VKSRKTHQGEGVSVEATVCIPSDVAEFEVEYEGAETTWLGKVGSIEIGLDELIERAVVLACFG